MTERTTGYSLLIIGILIMIFATIQIISVFTGRANPLPLFQIEEPTSTAKDEKSNSLLNQFQNITGTQDLELAQLPDMQIIDPEVLNKLLNLTVYYLIMQFLLGVGFKLSSLGVQLIRPIQVNMKNRILTSEQLEKTT